jgi:DNA-binding response OmpR family regulator
MATRILVVDDDCDVGRILKMTLEMAGYEVAVAFSGEGALERVNKCPPDLVLLDVGMPGMDGWEVCRRIREVSDVPIIMLTVFHREIDIVKGLKLGADDFVAKPWSNRELLVRIQAILRRANMSRANGWEKTCSGGELLIDIAGRRVFKNDRPIELTPIEFRLLTYLARRPGRIVPSSELIEQVWGIGFERDFGSLRWHIHNLRNKIETDPEAPRYILTKHGMGYCFANLDEQE